MWANRIIEGYLHLEIMKYWRTKEYQEGRDCFNNLEDFSFRDYPGRLNPYRDNIRSESCREWMTGWLEAAETHWEPRIHGDD